MPRARVSRTSWIRFFPEDFLGGVQQMDCRQVGQYMLMLCAQWGAQRGGGRSGGRGGVCPADGALRAILRGEQLDNDVREKFDAVTANGETVLRNQRMSLEIEDSQREYEAMVSGGGRTNTGAGGGAGTGAGGATPGVQQPQLTTTSTSVTTSTPTSTPHVLPADAGRDRQPRARRAAKQAADRPETRALCDAQSRLTGKPVAYSATMLEAFARLLDAGRTSAEIELVLTAYRDKTTPSALFARDGQDGRRGGPGLSWALRPGDAGGFDKILLQLDGGDLAPSGSPYEGAAERIRARMGLVNG